MSEKLSLRPAGPDDERFIMAVYASTREHELLLVPWSVEQKLGFIKMQHDAQQAHYKRYYPDGQQSVIMLGDRPVGRLYVARGESQLRILDITLLPEHRNRGIGASLIRELMAEAEAAGKPVTIFVETFNPSLNLFERLGFARKEVKGAHVLLEWRPATPARD